DFLAKLKVSRRKTDAAFSSYNLVQSLNNNNDYLYEFYKTIILFNEEALKVNIKEMIIDYMHFKGLFNEDIEKLSREFYKDKKDSVLYLSPYVEDMLFGNEIKSVVYNFFDDLNNALMSIYFELNGTEYKRFNMNGRSQDIEKNSIDLAVVFAPYRNNALISRLSKGLDNISQSFEWDAINLLSQFIKQDGTIVSFVSSGILNKVSDSRKRRQFVERDLIDTIIELPRLQLMSTMLALIVFDKNNEEITLIDASKFAQNLRRGINLDSDMIIKAKRGEIEGVSTKINKEMLEDTDYDLTPHHFLDEIMLNFSNPVDLKDLTNTIMRGFQIPSEMIDEFITDEDTKIKLLTLSSIDNGEIMRNELSSLKEVDKRMEHYRLESGDLVISCKGKTFKTAVVEIPYGETYISTGSFIIIRCNKEVLDPMYLKIFLDSDLGKSQLKRIQTGTTVLSLNPSKLETIKVPLPHLSKQLLIASSYKYRKKNLKEVEDVLKNMKEEIDKKFNKNFLSQVE
ncbi:MAG: restriction endonuclease subunit S, partial [Gammaproteobacteria bacterium]|nr:restriction endonuclease subunit S [Gammaproteobacteria bacterium]